MSASEPDAPTRVVEDRVARLEAELERRATFSGYSRLYAALAVVSAPLSFMPIFDDLRVDSVDGAITARFGNLWDMAGRTGGDPAALGLLLAMVLTALLIIATFKTRSVGLAVSIATVSVPIIGMLIARPATGDPKPDLSAFGLMGMVLAVFALVLATVHAIHIGTASRQQR